MDSSKCKYLCFDNNDRDACFYYTEKVKEKMPLQHCSESCCPILHPELLHNLTLIEVEK